ncbi:hypothetical protein [uncultured Microbacterium sp.]|uniref:hypothetical protein n=1 Tax=uncultured Microbacterium sp. TaxID=191216 RepID=UPI0025D5678A|nr:hypothetical protein [uncultured Microbacterium sp.]
MGTDYPGALDTFTNPAPTDGMNLPAHSAQHANANDAIAAIQAELGTNPSGSYDTVKDRLAALAGGGGGGGGGGADLLDTLTLTADASKSFSDGVFDDASYRAYKLIVDLDTNTADGELRAFLRASGTDSTAGNYNLSAPLVDLSGSVNIGSANAGYWLLNILYALGYPSAVDAVLIGPEAARYTTLLGSSHHSYTATNLRDIRLSGVHKVASAFDSLTLAVSAGTMTGTAWLYGLPK